jgi:hypothetical protein
VQVARALIQLVAPGLRIVEEGDAGHRFDRTLIACPPEFDEEARAIARRLEVEARIVAAIPNPEYDLTVYMGEDFATFEGELLRAWIRGFVEARREGNAERFIAPAGRDDYFETSGRTEARPGELYLYPERDIVDSRIDGFDQLDPDTLRFELRLYTKDPCASPTIERIWLHVVGDGRYELASAQFVTVLMAPGCDA